ncbi:hypothetical protein [Pseudomonas mandelii]|uniref:hypothetical protein n=1 Tax=Pseudomonas mandelii TaxID=75612 RepID=UPI00209F4150|nr:hypothetical protein [Pseudomonas mandelii]MCO8310385.1 hypothetical protein [Pseudomonas mandelii]
MEVVKNLRPFVVVNTRKEDQGGMAVAHWVTADGSVSYDSEPVPITDPGNDQLLEIAANEIERFTDKEVTLSYTITLNGNETTSPLLKVEVTPEMKYQPAIVEGLVDNALQTSDYPNGLTTTIPIIENLREYNALSLIWIVTVTPNRFSNSWKPSRQPDQPNPSNS